MQYITPFKCVARFVSLVGITALAFLAWSCSSDSGYKQIDFREKSEASSAVEAQGNRKALRVAVAAMISPKETFIYYKELIEYLGARSNLDVVLVQRRTYSEINRMLSKGQIDIAFICTGPYVAGGRVSGFKAVATPVVSGNPFYQSYLIVHEDSPLTSLDDLKGKTFAFTDPDSNTGALVPQYWLRQIGQTPEQYFHSTTYTYSHDNSIMAVAKNLVDGAAVDGHIWEYYRHRNELFVGKTRVIKKSDPFGSPPLVMSDALDPKIKQTLVEIIMSMHEDPQGAVILSELMIDRFTAPQPEWYAPVMQMLTDMGRNDLIETVTP